MKKITTKQIIFCALAIAINVILGIITSAIKLPVYLDTLGTILTAVQFGPWIGAIVGALTNIVTGLIYGMRDIPFLIVNVAVALIVYFMVHKFKFTIKTAIITGLILSVVCPLIGTPIGIFIYEGLNGSLSDIVVLALRKSGQSIFAASFIRNVFSNLIDKVTTMLLAYFLNKRIGQYFK